MPRPAPVLRAVILALLLARTADAAPIPTGPDGDAFYTPPAPLPSAAPGTLVWSRPYVGDAALPHARRNVLVLHHSRAVDGRDVVVSGVVSLPRRTRHAPVLSWAHGTTGGADVCAPSRSTADEPDREYVREIAGLLDAWVQAGWVVVQTDYEGLGTPGDHPYIIGDSAMRSMTDLVRAARQLDRRIGRQWIAAGHSEGGHAALFAAAHAAAWAPELRPRAAVAIAPGSQQSLIPAVLQVGSADLLQGVIGYRQSVDVVRAWVKARLRRRSFAPVCPS